MKRCALALLLTIGAPMTIQADDARDLEKRVPATAAGFTAVGQAEFFDADGLFKLINGGAEVYRSLGVSRVISRRFRSAQGGEIIADVFDMGSSSGAYGAYHHDMREGQGAGLGQESERQGGNLSFWKDRYFVSVVSLKADPKAEAAVLALGRAIAARIPEQGQPPAIAAWLPPDKLIKSQVHYFRDWALFSRLMFWGQDNLLGLDGKTEGILARYDLAGTEAGPPPAVFIIRYPAPEQAARAARALLTHFNCDREGVPCQTAEDGSAIVHRLGDTLAAAQGLASAALAADLMRAIEKRKGAVK